MLKPRKPLNVGSKVIIIFLNGHKWTKCRYPIDPLLEFGLEVLFLEPRSLISGTFDLFSEAELNRVKPLVKLTPLRHELTEMKTTATVSVPLCKYECYNNSLYHMQKSIQFIDGVILKNQKF